MCRRCRSSLEYITPAARGLFFAPAVVAKAEAVLAGIAAAGGSSFRGVHLRIEGDWQQLGPLDAQGTVSRGHSGHHWRAGQVLDTAAISCLPALPAPPCWAKRHPGS